MQTSAQPDLAWAAAVSAFAELLRGSPCATMQEVEGIRRMVAEQTARDADRREFGQLLELAVPKLGATARR